MMNLSPRARDRNMARRRAMRMMDRNLPWRPRHEGRRERAMPFVRSAGIAAMAGAIGAGCAYLFDPRLGRRRRAIARDRVVRSWHRSRARMRRLARSVNARGNGMRHRMMHRTIANPIVDDRTLDNRVQSTIFRDAREARGAVSVQVVEGVVELRGALDRLSDIHHLERAAAKVPGVRDVRSYLHLAGTDAPNKADALDAARLILREGMLRPK